MATNKVLNTLSTIQEIFVPSTNTLPAETPPPSSIEPTALPIVPSTSPPPGNHDGNGPPPAPHGRPDKDKDMVMNDLGPHQATKGIKEVGAGCGFEDVGGGTIGECLPSELSATFDGQHDC